MVEIAKPAWSLRDELRVAFLVILSVVVCAAASGRFSVWIPRATPIPR